MDESDTSGRKGAEEADSGAVVSEKSSPQKLGPLDRARLEGEIGNRLGVAFTLFVDACNEHLAALKAAAAESRDLLLVVADVALGLIAPGGGRALAGLLNSLPVASPEVVYSAAIKLMDNAGTVVSSVLNGGKRAAGIAMGTALRHTEDEAFIGSLKEGFAVAIQDVRAGLPSRSDAELLLVGAAYDARVVTRSAYSAEIGRLVALYKRDVKSIGEKKVMESEQPWLALGQLVGTEGLVSVESGGGPRLVRVRLEQRVPGAARPALHFVNFVSPEMRGAAAAKAKSVQPRGVQTVPAELIQGLPRGAPAP